MGVRIAPTAVTFGSRRARRASSSCGRPGTAGGGAGYDRKPNVLLCGGPNGGQDDANALVLLFFFSWVTDCAAPGLFATMCTPDWYEIRIRTDSPGKVCLFHGDWLCATRPAWEASLSAALRDASGWVAARLPELLDDPVLGPWLRGGAAPEFADIGGPAIDWLGRGFGTIDD
jgi:hypothetical protein